MRELGSDLWVIGLKIKFGDGAAGKNALLQRGLIRTFTLSLAGLSAVRRISGMPAWKASKTAGWRFATAVPLVVITATGLPDANAFPSAVKAIERSSRRTVSLALPALASCSAAIARACDLAPGER